MNADKELAKLKALAARWRKRLKNPQLRASIRRGEVAVSPLVMKLLKAFPAEGK